MTIGLISVSIYIGPCNRLYNLSYDVYGCMDMWIEVMMFMNVWIYGFMNLCIQFMMFMDLILRMYIGFFFDKTCA